MLVIVGLGNPGPEHAGQRHNVGFMAVDRIAARHRFGPWRRRFRGRLAQGALAGRRTLLAKPETFVNLSGRCAAEIARFYKLGPERIVACHDEIDLAPGKLRLKRGGGAAGHNGVRSLIAHLGPEFRRIRIGVGHPGRPDRVMGHVLRDFGADDRDWLEAVLDAVADAAPLLAQDQDDRFLSRCAACVASVLGEPPGRRGPEPK